MDFCCSVWYQVLGGRCFPVLPLVILLPFLGFLTVFEEFLYGHLY